MRLFVDNLTNVDFSYLDSERGMVGETWLASVELQGELDEQGMVCDFGIVKKMLRDWLDTEIDHRLVVPTQSHSISNLTTTNENISVTWQLTSDEKIVCESPLQAIAQSNIEQVTPSNLANWCINQLTPLFPATVVNVKLTFTPEQINSPHYHYSHGLKKHQGNCQRIAHGHRSKIEIWRNGEQDYQLMERWATTWEDIYIASNEDIIEQSNKETTFAYSSQQGQFRLIMPTNRCYFIETDTTVELIAAHILKTLILEHPEDSFTIKAYEGCGKGAVTSNEQ